MSMRSAASEDAVEVSFGFVVVLSVELNCIGVVETIGVELSRWVVSLNATSFVKTISGRCSKNAINFIFAD